MNTSGTDGGEPVQVSLVERNKDHDITGTWGGEEFDLDVIERNKDLAIKGAATIAMLLPFFLIYHAQGVAQESRS